jgi:catechol 2,3-dioxygenase-like lactoylglutathione lyase family enzyme
MLDHVGLEVSDLERSRAFYEAALAPLEISMVMEFEGMLGFGKETESGRQPYFWLAARGRSAVSGAHVAFGARTTERVDAFHAAALAAGGIDNGGPGLRPEYHRGYYGAFVLDPDGNNVEAVHHDLGASS